MKVLVTGASGLVGRAVKDYCAARDENVVALEHCSLDITDAAAIHKIFARERPEVVINCAAWTDVDGCELNPARSQVVNALGPELLALGSRRTGALLITISTDYVFDGEKEGFYTQRDHPAPKSVYGVTKLEGERRAQAAWARTIVVRTGFVFGAGGKNFLSNVVARARRGERILAIRDAYGTPTYAPHLAARLSSLAELDLPGTYHAVNSGPGVSYEEFARSALAVAGCYNCPVESVSMDSLKRPAPRPHNSRLHCLLSEAVGLDPMPFWEDAVRDFVAKTGN